MRAIAFEWETTHTSNGQISRIARVITYLHFHSTLFPRNTFQTRRMIPRNDRTERTMYPRCFVLFLSFRYFRLIIFRATVSYTRIRDEFHRTIIRTKPRSELSLAKAFSYLRERENHSLDIIRETLKTFILQFVRKLLKAFRSITRIR